MIAILDPNAAERLAKLCGLFGSEHDGERASAAAMADKLLAIAWSHLGSKSFRCARSRPLKQSIDFCLDDALVPTTAWEWGFLTGILATGPAASLQSSAASSSSFLPGYKA